MTVEFYARLPLHGETQFIPGDNRNRGDWNRSPADSSGAASHFEIGDDFTYIDYLSQVARRLGEHILPRFRERRSHQAANDLQSIPLVGGQGLEARGNS